MQKYCPTCGLTNTIHISNGEEICYVCSNRKEEPQKVYNSQEEYKNLKSGEGV